MIRNTVKKSVGWRSGLLWVALLYSTACNAPSGSVLTEKTSRRADPSQSDSPVVSTVDGVVITLSNVERIVQKTGLPRAEALAKLEAEQLLAAKAESLGFGAHPEVQYVVKQAMVQALLSADVEPTEVTQSEIEQAYQEDIETYRVPERRRALHVLAKVNEKASEAISKAAEAFARKAIRTFQSSRDVEEVFERYKAEKSDLFPIVAERLPVVPRKGDFVKEFEDAMFGIAKPGVVAEPVRTAFGWHAIVLLEIQPAKNTSIDDVADELRQKIMREKRKAILDELVDHLRKRIEVVQEDSVIEYVLKTDNIVVDRE
jgi:parvulin-like peptidyl-prolyl isomerase